MEVEGTPVQGAGACIEDEPNMDLLEIAVAGSVVPLMPISHLNN
ncbi:MAG TPA: hypothetical protein VGM27_21130 [Acidobacteriaceae bacterium]